MPEKTDKTPRDTRRSDLAVFVLLLVTYAYFHSGGGPSQNSRYALTRSLVRSGTLEIDRYEKLTIDKARYGGRTYSDKAPGLALFAVPGYAASLLVPERAKPGVAPELQGRLHVTSLLSVGLVSALGAVLLLRLLRGVGVRERPAVLATLAWGLGTPALAYATMLMSHQFAAALLIASAYGIFRARDGGGRLLLAGSGAAAGLAVIAEYPAAVVGLILFAYALASVRPRSRVMWFAIGAIPLLCVAPIHNWLCFDAPWRTGYQFEASPFFRKQMAQGFMGLTWPRPWVAWQMLFGAYRGLLPLAPYLVLALPGFVLMRRDRTRRREWWLCLSVTTFYLLFGSSYYLWQGGCSMGPRHLVPMLPFLTIPAAFGLARLKRTGLVLVICSIAICVACVATFPEFPDSDVPDPSDRSRTVPEYPFPIRDVALRHLAEGRVSEKAVTPDGKIYYVTPRFPDSKWDAYNLGEVFGLRGAWSLAPLLLFWVLMECLVLHSVTRSPGVASREARLKAVGRYALPAVLIAAALLLLWGLGRPMFWSDEAITAIYSRNTLRYGWPRAWDGRNLCAYGSGTSIGPRDLGAWTYPLLQFYTTAGSFAVFGVSTWAARLPHALMALATVWLTFAVARRMGLSRNTALIAALALAGCVQFLRFGRNCRYFSLTVFLAAMWVWLYLRMSGKPWREWWRPGWTAALLGLVSLLLFHAHFFVGGVFGCAAAVAILTVDRDWRKLPTLVPMGAVAVVLALTHWGLVVRPAGVQPFATGDGRFWADALTRLGWYVRDLNLTQMLPLGVVAGLVVTAGAGLLQREEQRAAMLLGVLIVAHVLLTAAFSPQPVRRGTIDADVRYAAPLLPFAAILGAIGFAAILRRVRWLGVLLLVLWLGTGVFSLNPSRSFLADFAVETFRLRDVPQTSTEATVAVLRKQAKQDDVVLVTPDYRRDPLMFYLGDRLRFCGILPPDDQRIVPHARTLGLPEHVYAAQVEPEFIIWFRREKRGLPQHIFEHVRKLPYTRPMVLRVWWDDLSRPELTRHSNFPPVVGNNNLPKGVWIVRRDRRP